ncbi:MAG: ATP-dependent DNA helicase RecG [Coriobacteriia bacterium]|nr:ATP-dependent DNA helicase RecG [Coriobacteriia bacterium]
MTGAGARAHALAAWERPATEVRFVDADRAEALGRLGMSTVRDLLEHYPFRYLDLTSTPRLAAARHGEEVTVTGRVHDVKLKRPRRRLSVVEVAIVDGTGVLLGVWFNQPYLARRFAVGQRVAFAGRVDLDFGLKQIRNPYVERLDEETATAGRVLPVHRATEGVSTNWMRRLVREALDAFGDVPDPLPAHLRLDRDLVSRRAALRGVHFPASLAEAEHARRRLAYEELLVLQIGLALRRHAAVDRPGHVHAADGPRLDALRQALPFTLTADQRHAVADVLADMAAAAPMNRILLGDVGTGKTAVASFALAAATDSGTQAAMMAPTEVLAAQYARKVGPLLDAAGARWALLTGSTPAAERREVLGRLERGELDVAFGTHALLEESVTFARLTLAIVDEQHRFGVSQRLGLRGKGEWADLLVMTATPIPRSLALTLYGDLDASYLRERPAGLDPAEHVTTEVVGKTGREGAYAEVRREVAAGHQAYVVCPLVDESDAAEATAATAEAERLAGVVFPELRVALLTGRMRPVEKADVMDRFRAGEVDVLVSTTVIEVGVDVPNATVMIVEDAERFGLSQLHQLRGRVGRGAAPGRFLLFADPRTEESRRRTEAIASTTDGFALAEEDLRLRGEGQVLGERQHGMPQLKLASVLTDVELLDAARADAAAVVGGDPRLGRPEHRPLAEEVRARIEAAWEWVSSG